jgi:tRNA A-37 threonylcarbamoyl transferase component Bud32
MTARPRSKSRDEGPQIAFFREVLREIRGTMHEKYGLSRVSVRPIKADASRLSIPVKITGVNRRGEQVRYFGKILGSNDIISDRSMQFFKNLYLQMNAQDPIFGFTETAEEMARQQYESLQSIYDAGIPTAAPLGYHRVNDSIWLLVTQFLESHPVSEVNEVTVEQIDTLFGYLRTMHRKGIFHGDIKPENIMLGDRIYVLDAGVFRTKTDPAKKKAYDLACLVCSFLDCHPLEGTVANARRYFPRQELQNAVEYIDLIQQRQDFHFGNQQKLAIKRALRG